MEEIQSLQKGEDGKWVPVSFVGARLIAFNRFIGNALLPRDFVILGVAYINSKWHFVGNCSLCGRERAMPQERIRSGLVCNCQKVEKHKATCLERYGVEFSTQAKEVKDRIKETMIERYGVENAFELPEVREKALRAYAERGEEIKEKVAATCLERYGVRSALSVKEVRDRQSKTRFNSFLASLELVDTDELVRVEPGRSGHKAIVRCRVCGKERKANGKHSCPCQISIKAQATCMDRYGVKSTNELEWKKEKAKATNREKYGVDFASQNPEVMKRVLLSHHNTMKKTHFRSVQEAEIAAFVESLGLSQRKHASRNREIDIFIESMMLGIEFNGTYWHSEAAGKTRSYHIGKTKQAAAEGITVIHIWSHIWETRRSQVESFLRAKLGKCANRIGVRKCNVREISKDEAISFVETYHIQGANKRIDLAIGAFVGDELVAVSTFSPHHRGGAMKTLSRLCTKTDWVVSGFLGKAVRLAFAKFGPIVSWVDLSLSKGDSYLSAGFRLDATLPPDYAYVKGGGHKVIKKQSFRKIDDRTERQRAKDEKLHRFWDCGKLRFIFDGK